jgi:hypothetical protein
MRSFVRIIPIIALLAAGASVASAQLSDTSHAAPRCGRDLKTAGSYMRCALWTDGRELKRGVPSEEVSHVHLLTPLALSHFVIGDSARRYALSYERNARRWLQFRYVGTMLITVGVLPSIRRPCQKPRCIGSYPSSMNRPLVVSGAVLDLASLSFKSRAAQASTQALWWHNAPLAR